MPSNNYRIAYINFWANLFTPNNGGNLRAHGLFNSLSKFTNAELMNVNGLHDVSKAPIDWKIKNIQGKAPIRLKFILRIISVLTRKGIFLSSDSRNTLVAGYHSNWFSEYSHVVLTSRDMLLIAPIIRIFNSSLTVIYDSHNVDYLQAKQQSKAQKKIRFLESLIPHLAHQIWCCSDIDRSNFIRLNKRFDGISLVVPNGATYRGNLPQDTEHIKTSRSLGILASWNYPPNVEGLEWFLHSVTPLINEDVRVIVCGIGKLPYKLLQRIKIFRNVEFIGSVEDILQFYEATQAIAIPLQKGSGTRLKAIEAMSFAKPMVSTSKGIEGIELENQFSCLVADSAEEFAHCINRLFEDRDLRIELGTNAYDRFLAQYTWDVIVKNTLIDMNQQGSSLN